MIEQTIILSDEPELAKVIESSFFGREGYSLKKVSNGADAFKAIEEDAPVLAILSLDMQEFCGEACFRKIKNDPFLCLLPVILVCSNNSRELQICKGSGCDNVITRPIDSWTLISMACRLLHIVGRASPRRRVSIPVSWEQEDENIQSGKIIDLNSGGMFIQTDTFLSPEKVVSLRFTLPGNNQVICCQGKVAWINHPEWIKSTELPAGMGICFSSISGADSIAIQTYFQKQKA